MTRLVLWDLDGTLVHTAGIGGAVFDTALEAALGRRPEDRVRMGGKTDPQIVREYLELMHEDLSHAPAILRHLEQGLAAAAERLAEDGSPMPGVVALLQRLAVDPDVISSVLTGNIAPNAVVKLAAFGLDRWLDLEVGAYGSDDANRDVLVPLAMERARTLRDVRLDAGDVWIVGDTPRDLACASAAGAHCLLVATGGFTIDELRGLGADVILADLRQTDEVVAILTGAVTRSPGGGLA
jgi:phosphoglycolate phosphatase